MFLHLANISLCCCLKSHISCLPMARRPTTVGEIWIEVGMVIMYAYTLKVGSVRGRVDWQPDVWAVRCRPPGRLIRRDRDSRSVPDEQLLPDGSARPLRLKVADARTPNLTNYSNREKWHRMMVRSSKFGCLRYQGIRQSLARVHQLLL